MDSMEIGGLDIRQDALMWKFVRASGPGGQHVNKVSTAVECRLDLHRANLPLAVRQRLERLAGSRLNGRGEVVLFADRERSQTRNRAELLERLAALIAAARIEPKPRVATKLSVAKKAKRREDKRHRSTTKQHRRPPEHAE